MRRLGDSADDAPVTQRPHDTDARVVRKEADLGGLEPQDVGDVGHEGYTVRNHHDVLGGMRADDVVDGGAHPRNDAGRRLLELESAVIAELEVNLDESGVLLNVMADDSRRLHRSATRARVDRGRAGPAYTFRKSFSLPAAEGAQWGIGGFGHAFGAVAV